MLNDFLAKRISITPECWEWTSTLTHDGYGYFVKQGKKLRAHRVVFESFGGSIPEGMVIDHLCRNRKCVNPAHLEAVTFLENVRRGVPFRDPSRYIPNNPNLQDYNRARRAATSCSKGHDFSDVNTFWTSQGRRKCRICMNATRKINYYRKRAVHG